MTRQGVEEPVFFSPSLGAWVVFRQEGRADLFPRFAHPLPPASSRRRWSDELSTVLAAHVVDFQRYLASALEERKVS